MHQKFLGLDKKKLQKIWFSLFVRSLESIVIEWKTILLIGQTKISLFNWTNTETFQQILNDVKVVE